VLERLARYLERRLRVGGEVAEQLIKFVIKAERSYLLWLYGYDKLKRVGIDELDLLERLKRPFVFGFFVKEVLESSLEDDVKYKTAREGWRSIDVNRDEGIPAYLFKTVNYLLSREGFKREYFDTLIRISLSLPDLFRANFTVMSDEISDVEALFDYVLGLGELTVDEKICFLAAVLKLRDIKENVRLRIYEKFLRSDYIPFSDRLELCRNAADSNTLQYFLERLKPYMPAELSIGPFKVPPHFLLINIPTLTRRSIRWLAEVEQDRRRLVEKYFKEIIMDYYEVYQSLGALDICRQYHREIGVEYCVGILRKALKANRVEVRRVAERYLKELSSQTQ
jgi:hypothetical protein